MDQFNYLIVVTGLVIGLGLTHILSALVDYIQNRHNVRLYWLVFPWAFMLFISQVEYWYVLFDSGSVGKTLPRFLASLLYPICMYLASGLLLPRGGEDGKLDLKERYYDNHRWFFALCALGLVVVVFYDGLVFGDPLFSKANLFAERNYFRYIGIVLLLSMMAIVKEFYHILGTLAALATLLYFWSSYTF